MNEPGWSAGHGSTLWDYYGNLWHSATMRISMNHQFERRVGIWPAGFDEDGELFCNQRSGVNTELSHDLLVREDGIQLRYLKLTIIEVPYGHKPCISGFRIFGKGIGEKPQIPKFKAKRTNDFDMQVDIKDYEAIVYCILWGHRPDKLYHSYMAFESSQRIGALVKGRQYYVRVDAFNENGITDGKTVLLEEN